MGSGVSGDVSGTEGPLTWEIAIATRPPVQREISSGVIEPGTDDAVCIVCDVQALLYALDVMEFQWFTCLDHHGLIVSKLIRGELDGMMPPLS